MLWTRHGNTCLPSKSSKRRRFGGSLTKNPLLERTTTSFALLMEFIFEFLSQDSCRALDGILVSTTRLDSPMKLLALCIMIRLFGSTGPFLLVKTICGFSASRMVSCQRFLKARCASWTKDLLEKLVRAQGISLTLQ